VLTPGRTACSVGSQWRHCGGVALGRRHGPAITQWDSAADAVTEQNSADQHPDPRSGILHGGHQTHGELTRPVARLEQLSYYPRLVGLVRDLAAAGHTPTQIAAAVNAEGLRPPKRTDRFTAASIQVLMRRLGIRPARPRYRTDHLTADTLGEHEWRLPDLARELGMPTASLYHWIYRGWVTGRRDPDHPHRWILHADDHELATLREHRTRPAGYHSRHRFLDTAGRSNPRNGGSHKANTNK
jgi:hypothetical protein